jgi:hypothetical protein
MKNKYYQEFEEFYNAVSLFFKNFMVNINGLVSLLTLNFGIIKTS